MKRALAAILTLGLLAAALWFGRKAPSVASAATTPADCIERMYAAMEHGDVETFLDCFTGPERKRLDRALESQSRKAVAQDLIEEFRQLKGRAYFDPRPLDAASNAAEVTLERVFAHRLERQTLHLVRERGAWRIDRLQTAGSVQPEKPYGEPVFELAPAEQP